jgi:uncharacterized membrane protein
MPPFVVFILGGSMESKKRSLIKTFSWQAVHMTLVAGTIYVLTGEWEIAGIAALAELVWETAAYYVHERAWARWGKKVK